MEEISTSPSAAAAATTSNARPHVTFNFEQVDDYSEETISPKTSRASNLSSVLGSTSSNNKQITNRQLAQLLPLVPIMIHWLRDAGGANSGSLLVGTNSATFSEEEDLLRKFLDALNFSSDLTIHQVRELGEAAQVKIWASALRRIVTDSDPGLVPSDIAQALIRASAGADTDMAGTLSKMKQALDGLTRTQYTALGELCALFRDTDGGGEIANLVGARLLKEDSALTAQGAMQLLIGSCEALFGRSAALCKDMFCLGDVGRNTVATTTSYLPKVSHLDALTSSRKHALKAFFQWNDEKYVGAVDALFQHHSFRDIAWGVWDRYENLPGGWRGELEELKESGDPDYAWVPGPGQGNKPLSHPPTTASSQQQQQQPEEETKPGSSRRLLRRMSNWSTPPTSPGFSNINLVINEILDTEMVYYTMLKEMQDNYVSLLREIASQKGERATALGISLLDIESVFGWRLAQVIEASKTLLGHLAIVNLVRQEVSHYPGGRSMVVANAFALIAPDLSSSYAPFITGHRHGMSVLGKASQNLRESSGGPGALMKTRSFFSKSVRLTKGKSLGLAGFGSGNGTGGGETIMHDALQAVRAAASSGGGKTGGESAGQHFMALWEDIRESSKLLSGQSLQSVMITPIQRIPRYKLLLIELQKKLTQNHPALTTLNVALEQISIVAQQVNQALRQHEKLENLIGKETMPEINGTTMNLNKHQSFRLAVTYKALND